MPAIFIDKFNSYNDGDLNGQGGWSGNAIFDIQGVTVKEGAKAVKWTATNDLRINRTGLSKLDDGRMTIYMRLAQTNARAEFRLRETTTDRFGLMFFEDGGVDRIVNGSYVNIQAYNANQWYLIEIEWRSSDHKLRVQIDGGGFTTWEAGYASWTDGIDDIQFNTQNPSGEVYFDFIAENPFVDITENAISHGANF